jgi:hypothetical protein
LPFSQANPASKNFVPDASAYVYPGVSEEDRQYLPRHGEVIKSVVFSQVGRFFSCLLSLLGNRLANEGRRPFL